MSNKVGVFAPLEKACRKTFASLRKRVSKAKGDKVTSINADRAFFSRLLIIANTRTLNLRFLSTNCQLYHIRLLILMAVYAV